MAPDAYAHLLQEPAGHSRPPALTRVAVLCRQPALGPAWGTDAAQAQAGALVADGLVHFDYFPIPFAEERGGDAIVAAFEAIERDAGAVPFDTIVIAGGPDIETDIGVVHRVLAPRIARATLPVLTALGPDDVNTILGDHAWRVFPDPHALLGFIAAAVRKDGMRDADVVSQIRSLAGFFVTEQAVETKILMHSAFLPVLEKRFRGLTERAAASQRAVQDVTQALKLRMVREEAELEQTRARIGVELARLAQARGPSVAVGLGALRFWLILGFLCTVAMLWLGTTPAATVFFSGCMLVVLSAVYVALSNRIIDQPEFKEVTHE